MLRIRLQRVGRKHETAFRLVVVDRRRGPQSGCTLEVLGSYDPRRGKPALKAERIKHWLSVGAQASGTVHNLLIDAKILTGAKVNVLPKRKPKAEVSVGTSTEIPVEIEKPAEVALPEIPIPISL
ncbi:MAG TPA: 30S ribosomal protein S16 [Candidatus Paceibacterota bacterium]